jgi:hypothetical protein
MYVHAHARNNARPEERHATHAHPLLALQQSAGNRAVQRLVRLARPPRQPSAILTTAERRAFVQEKFPAGRQRRDAMAIIEDMAATSNVLDFMSQGELHRELIKRVTMTEVMRDSQETSGGLGAFGYPFTRPSLYWGPRVNAAAAPYWEPPVVDAYSLRNDPAKRREIREKPRNQRHTVFGDPAGGYRWTLTQAGRTDPYEAIMRLFEPQPAHRRSLIHCDYLVSLAHFRATMAMLGRRAFNAQIARYGPGRIILRWNLFAELEPPTAARPGMGEIRQVVPASPADLVIGDHVYFWNNAAYDVINRNVGNAWRLENAVLVAKSGGADVFLGHGSGRKTEAQMRAKLAEEYNDVATTALRLVRRARQGSASARDELRGKFGVTEVGGQWRIRGTGLQGVAVDQELRLLRPSDIPGLYAPSTPGVMYPVRRPSESA